MYQPTPTAAQIGSALRTMLLAILPPGIEVIQGQDNNVAEPQGDFVVMTTILRTRLGTNRDTYADCKFTGLINAGTLTVSRYAFGSLAYGNTVYGTGTSPDPYITALNADGTATLSAAITIPSTTLAAGVEVMTQPTDVNVQLDVHSNDLSAASDYAQVIATMFRDDRGYQALAASGFPITPLYTDDPKQMPFTNAEGQFESRYVVMAHLQVDQTITPSQQFADTANVGLIPVDIFYRA